VLLSIYTHYLTNFLKKLEDVDLIDVELVKFEDYMEEYEGCRGENF